MKRTILGSTLVAGLLAALSLAGWAKGEIVDETTAPCASEEKSDILETASRAGSFTTLTRAIEAAGLSETLRGEGPFTVFAPSDQAFSQLPPGTLDNLLLPENKERLRSLLLHHVAAGLIDSRRLESMSAIPMLAGQPVAVAWGFHAVAALLDGRAWVYPTDIMASNGVIHSIDTVLLPEEPATNPREPGTNPQEPALTPHQPVRQPQEPALTPQEPGTRLREPAAPPEEKSRSSKQS